MCIRDRYKLYLSNPYLHSLEVYSSYGNTLFGNYPGNSRQITVCLLYTSRCV